MCKLTSRQPQHSVLLNLIQAKARSEIYSLLVAVVIAFNCEFVIGICSQVLRESQKTSFRQKYYWNSYGPQYFPDVEFTSSKEHMSFRHNIKLGLNGWQVSRVGLPLKEGETSMDYITSLLFPVRLLYSKKPRIHQTICIIVHGCGGFCDAACCFWPESQIQKLRARGKASDCYLIQQLFAYAHILLSSFVSHRLLHCTQVPVTTICFSLKHPPCIQALKDLVAELLLHRAFYDLSVYETLTWRDSWTSFS